MRKLLYLLVVSTTFIYTTNAQDIKNTWEAGIGFALTKFSDSDATFIGDKHLFQIPRLNLTIPINDRVSIDGALSFNTINDVSLVSNQIKYFSLDGSVRYNFDALFDNFYPYAFVGGSYIDSEIKATPTINAGAGATYWFSESFGVNSQVYYKHSFESFESMRSHIQGTLGIVYSFHLDSLFGGKRGGSGNSACD